MAFDSWTQITTSAAFPGKKGPRIVVHQSKMFLTGGDPDDGGEKTSDVWVSLDGNEWSATTLSATTSGGDPAWAGRSVHGLVSDGDYMYIFGGSTTAGPVLNDFWRSQDGVYWELLNSACDWSPRHEFGYVYMNGRIYLYGGFSGYKNDCWSISTSSYDSLTGSWTQEMADTGSPGANQWSQRREMAYCVHDDKMWCIGGDSGGFNNDVWYSSDGATWYEATSAAEFDARREHAAFSFQGNLWIVAGWNGTLKDDSWYTSAATTDDPWIEFVPTISFTPRFDAAVTFYDNAIYIMAGDTTS